jgi:hypothetical protein
MELHHFSRKQHFIPEQNDPSHMIMVKLKQAVSDHGGLWNKLRISLLQYCLR